MMVGGGSVQAADKHHVGIALGGEVHRSLPQGGGRGIVDDRVDRPGRGQMRRAVEDCLHPGGLGHSAGTMSKKRVFMPFWFSYNDPCSVAGGNGSRIGA